MSEPLGTVGSWLVRAGRESGPWGEFVVTCGAGTAVLAALAWIGGACARRERTRLGFWRVALVLAGLLALAEFTGLGQLRQATPANTPATPSSLPPATAGVDPTGNFAGSPSDSPTAWPLLVWAGVFGVLGLRLLVRAVRLHRFAARLSPIVSDELQQRLESVARTVGFRQLFRVVVAPGLQSPLVFGILRPVLVLPADFESAFPGDQQEAVLAHEFGHLAQHDPFWQSVAQWVTVVLWWNPAVWFLRARHAEAGEAAADAEARRLPDGAILLAESLVALGHRLVGARLAGLSATGRVRSRLGRRVRRLLAPAPAPSEPRESGRRRLAQFVAAPIVLVALMGTTNAIRSREAGVPESAFDVTWNALRANRTPVAGPAAAAPQPDTVVPPPVDAGRKPADAQRSVAELSPIAAQVRRVGREPKSDAVVFARLSLNEGQKTRVQKLEQEVRAARRALLLVSDAQAALRRKAEIDRMWLDGLRQALTEQQLKAFYDYWEIK